MIRTWLRPLVLVALGLVVASAAPAAPAATPPGPADTLLAEFTGGVVTPSEFSAAYRVLMPNERPPGSRLEARQTFLVRMVDRKLLALEAKRGQVELTPAQAAELERTRRQIIQNELFAQLTAGLEPSDADLETLRRQRTQLADVRFITFPSEPMARTWRMRLSTGTPMSALDELLRKGGPGAPEADSFRVVAADQIPDTLATVIWALRPGQVSEVHLFAGHPVLLHVRAFPQRPGVALNEDRATLQNEWQTREYDRVRQRLRSELVAATGRTFVEETMEALLAAHLRLPPRRDVDSVTGMPVMRPNLPLPHFSVADTHRVLARTKTRAFTLGDYLVHWGRIEPYARPEVRERPVLEATVDRVVLEDDIIALAVARGIDRSPRVVEQLEHMREGFALDQFYERNILARVDMDEDKLRRYFASRPGHYDDPATVEARILVVHRKELADSLLALLRGGRSFADLAREWSTEGTSAAKGGLTGPIARGTNTNVGLEDAMFATAVGALGGPEQTPEGWVIWKIEGRKPGVERTFEQAREWVERDYKAIEGEKILGEVLEGMREKAKAKIYLERVTLDLGTGSEWGN